MDKELIGKLSAIALNDIFGYEPELTHRIIDALGSPEAVFSLPDEERLRVFGPYSKYAGKINDGSLEKAEKQLDRLNADGYRVVSIMEAEYPSLLRECEDCPAVLYVRSMTDAKDLFGGGQAVSVVGTRDISLYGKEWCTRIVRAISQMPVRATIVSGLAIGVDVTAHLAALACGLPTVAVLPVGINDVYPRRHSVIADKIASAPGSALVTDFPPDTPVTVYNFLRRNRIIAGLSQSTVLVESKAKGGGTMTARLAAGYQRNVFALPGRIDDVRSAGCNRLLREKIAEPVDSLESLPEMLGLGHRAGRNKSDIGAAVRARYAGMLGDDEVSLLSELAVLIGKKRGISLDEICECGKMSYSEAARYAGILESDGFICIDLLQRCSVNPEIL